MITFKFTSMHPRRPQGLDDPRRHQPDRHSDLPGPGAVNPIAATRKLLPTYTDIDERNNAMGGQRPPQVGNTSAVVSVGGNDIANENIREMQQNIGEPRAVPLARLHGAHG